MHRDFLLNALYVRFQRKWMMMQIDHIQQNLIFSYEDEYKSSMVLVLILLNINLYFVATSNLTLLNC